MLRLLLLTALVALPVHGATLWFGQEEEPTEPTAECLEQIDDCAKRHLISGSCRSTSAGMYLDWLRNDVDNNCKVNGLLDYVPEIQRYYDPNGDGTVCREEWNSRRITYHGFTEAFANYEWDSFDRVNDCVTIESVKAIEDIDLRTTFADTTIRRMVEFCQLGDNQRTNKDCVGLPMMCKEYRKDLPACKDLFDQNIRTLYESLIYKAEFSDENKDGYLDDSEVYTDWTDTTRFDLNLDGCTDRTEWRNRESEFFGFTPETADYIFNIVDANGDGCLNKDDTDIFAPTGFPTNQLPIIILEAIKNMCEATPSMYETNRDCAMIADTCYSYFSDSRQACDLYVDNCGPVNYEKCFRNLSLYPTCQGKANREEIRLEARRVKNQLTEECVAYNRDIACELIERMSSRLARWYTYYV